MFDIGWSELLVIGVVAIVVVGPKELPRLLRSFGQFTGKLRRMAAEFQRQFEDAVRDSEIDDVRKAMQDFHDDAPSVNLRAPVDKPLMTPKSEPVSAPAQAALPPPAEVTAEAKPKRPPRKRAAAKPTAVEEPVAGGEPAAGDKPPAERKPRKPRKAKEAAP